MKLVQGLEHEYRKEIGTQLLKNYLLKSWQVKFLKVFLETRLNIPAHRCIKNKNLLQSCSSIRVGLLTNLCLFFKLILPINLLRQNLIKTQTDFNKVSVNLITPLVIGISRGISCFNTFFNLFASSIHFSQVSSALRRSSMDCRLGKRKQFS